MLAEVSYTTLEDVWFMGCQVTAALAVLHTIIKLEMLRCGASCKFLELFTPLEWWQQEGIVLDFDVNSSCGLHFDLPALAVSFPKLVTALCIKIPVLGLSV